MSNTPYFRLKTCRLQGEDNNSATELQLVDEFAREIAFKIYGLVYSIK